MARRKTRISLQDIATELNISRNAVSLALAGKPGIGPELRQRIHDSAERLQYRGPTKASITKGLNFISLAPEFPAGENPFYTHIFSGIEQGLKSAGHHLMFASVTNNQYDDPRLPSIFQTIKFAGILLIGAFPARYIQKIQSSGLPMVIVDHQLENLPVHTVGCTNSSGMYQLTQLILNSGHTDIGFIGPIQLSRAYYERWTGFCRAMEQADVERNKQAEITESWPIDQIDNLEIIRSAMRNLPHIPRVFICLSDLIAMSVMVVLREMGLRIPTDVSLTGFDDIQAAHLTLPPLTTYRAPRLEMGREAARYICQLVAQPGLPPSQREMYGSLQIRESVLSLTGKPELQYS